MPENSLYELHLPRKTAQPYPLILILPILGRFAFLPDFWVERQISKFYVKRGFACAILHRDFFNFDPGLGIEQIESYLTNTVKAAQKMLDELLQRTDVDPARIGSLGISFGAMINVLLANRDSRVKACVVALGGGTIGEILTTSGDPLVQAYCRTILNGLQLTRQELCTDLNQSLTQEPLKAAETINPDKVLMIIAQFDHVVKLPYALALQKALRNPQTILLPLGHYFSLLAMPYLNRKGLEFFQRKFSKPETDQQKF